MAISESTLLRVRALSISYGVNRAVQGISFDLPRGQSLAVAGGNGAGKTTLLNALAGLRIRHQTLLGIATFKGTALRWGDMPQRLAAGIRLVPERDKVFGLLTVAENLKIGKYRSRNGHIGLEDVLGWFPRLGARGKALAGNLSGGEQQMLGIALSLLASPELLLLDEPTLGLAVPVIEDLCASLARLRRESGLTMIVAESDSQWLSALADRAIVMDRGRELQTFERLAGDDLATIHDLMLGLARPHAERGAQHAAT